MPTSLRVACAALPVLLLGGCATDGTGSLASASDNFGEANRQTMMAQVIDPTPEYDTAAPAGNGEQAAKAVERYRKDQVKKPERVKTTNAGLGTGGGGSGSGSGSN